jgi:hypothetical protein
LRMRSTTAVIGLPVAGGRYFLRAFDGRRWTVMTISGGFFCYLGCKLRVTILNVAEIHKKSVRLLILRNVDTFFRIREHS